VTKLHLAIDIGSESGRAIAGYLENKKITTREIYRFKTQDLFLNKRLVRNVYRYYEEILTALVIFTKEFGTELSSIGVDAWGSDFALLDKDDRLMFLPISYRDGFARNMHIIVEKNIGIDRVYELTGNQMMLSDTLHQLLALKQNGYDLNKAQCILSIADLFHYFLSGAIYYEHSLASYSRLFDNKKQEWADEIFEALDIPKNIKTNICYSTDKIGTLYNEICETCGISNKVKIISPCAHDTACAVFSIPDLTNDWGFISSGTWSLVGIETSKPIINDVSRKHNISNSGLPFHKNLFKKCIAGMWLIHQCKLLWKDISYDEIIKKTAQENENNIYIDTDFAGFYSPQNMLKEIQNYVERLYKKSLDIMDVGKIGRIISESLACKYKYVFDYLFQASNKKISKVYILGGGSKNRLLNQMTANILNMEVYTGLVEATSVGNLLLQLCGDDEVTSENECEEILINTFPQKKFIPKDVKKWEAKFYLWKDFYLNNSEKTLGND